jgi:hypothetical protein
MNIFEFMSGSPLLTGFIAAVLVLMISDIVRNIIRHRNIAVKGWPPAHCDADGDIPSLWHLEGKDDKK